MSNNAPDTGSSQNLSTTTAGQSAQFTFTAAALQSFVLAFSNMVLTPSTVTTYTVKVLNPAGANINNGSCTAGTTCLVPVSAATTGAYTVTVTPGGSATMSFTASVGPLRHRGVEHRHAVESQSPLPGGSCLADLRGHRGSGTGRSGQRHDQRTRWNRLHRVCLRPDGNAGRYCF